jgi:hypothetical protein
MKKPKTRATKPHRGFRKYPVSDREAAHSGWEMKRKRWRERESKVSISPLTELRIRWGLGRDVVGHSQVCLWVVSLTW